MPSFTYKLLEHVVELYADVDLSNTLLLACQHLKEPQYRMFELLLNVGLKPENCIIVGKNYSTNNKVMDDLNKLGCIVAPFSNEFDPLVEFDEWFEEKLITFVSKELEYHPLKNYRKVIILDDGGFMHLVVNKLCRETQNVIGIEQTSSGHYKIEGSSIKFPTISVARSYHKLTFESPFIGRNGQERISHHVQTRNKSNPNVLVFGLGPIGQQVAGRLLLLRKHKGFVTDIRSNSKTVSLRAGLALLRNKRVISTDQAMEQIGEFDVVIGCTGSSLFSANEIDRLHPEVSLISMSSSDREFPALSFRHAGGALHKNYWKDGRCLVNGGFPITFDDCRNAVPPQQIEFTIALLMIRLMDDSSCSPRPLSHVIERIRLMWDSNKGVERWYKTFANKLS